MSAGFNVWLLPAGEPTTFYPDYDGYAIYTNANATAQPYPEPEPLTPALAVKYGNAALYRNFALNVACVRRLATAPLANGANPYVDGWQNTLQILRYGWHERQ